jgi:LacI family transcriptional regulator
MISGVRALAKKSGFSVATVSRVLNGSSVVKKETREHILAVARELNFFPNPTARALATQRTRVIGAVIPTIEHSIFATFISTLEESLAVNNYSLVLAITNFDATMEKERGFQLMNMGAEALLISGLEHEKDLLTAAASRDVPVLCTDIYNPSGKLPSIGYDNHGLGRQAAQYLKGLGHDRIAVLHGGVETNDRTRLRLAGVRSVFDAAKESFFVETMLSVKGGASATHRLLSLKSRPTAILCLSDVLALGAIFGARRLKLEMPEDVSIMGFDDLEWAEACEPSLTTIGLPVVEMGRAAAEALIQRLDNGTPIRSLLLKGTLIVRDSTGKKSGK